MKKLAALIIVFWITCVAATGAQTLTKHPEDQSVSRNLVLENGLKVLLVSDPAFNKSAASLEVQAGSLMDPEDRQGLAHFLEHMLFLGNKKYPEVDEFSNYLESHGGYTNAFTGEDRSNYHFEIQHDAFDGALDRFSQFFISPLFSPEYTEREINAVHSEHQKNLEQDDWREHQLFKTFYRKEHPANHFATGNIDTLKGVKQDEFINFYNTYYSANRMSLVLLSNKGLDELEKLAREYFLPVKNNHLEKIKYEPDYQEHIKGLRIIKRLPVKDIRELTLMFSIPSFIEHYKTKPETLVGFCMGHEGEGSLLSYLKSQGLATGLSAGGGNTTTDYGSFMINIKLTQKGVEQYQDIIKYCFSYIRLLKEKGIPDYIFREIQRIAELDYTYKYKGEGADRASHLAGNMSHYPPELAETVDYIYEKPEPGLIDLVLKHLIPENMLCMLTAKEVATDSTEQYYGTRFSYSVEKGKPYKSIVKPPKVNELALPMPNPFLPENVRLLAEQPVNIINEQGIEMWYALDTTFKRPEATIVFRLKHEKGLESPAYMARLSLYTACVNEMLNEIAYPASQAGLDFRFSEDMDGINLIISGYSASIPMLLKDIGSRLKSIELSEQQFNDIKERKIQEWGNFKMGQAWEIARHVSRMIRKEKYFSVDSILAEGKLVELKELKGFTDVLYKRARIEGIAHGNISAEETVTLTRMLQSSLNSAPINKEDTFKQAILVEKANDPQTYTERLETNNSCLWKTVYLGSETPELRMAASIIDKFVSQPFYTEMRTNQQLGYIVSAAAQEDNGQHYLFFIVQSESHPADDIGERANRFIDSLPSNFEALPDNIFTEFKTAVRTELLQKPKSIMEKAMLFDRLTFEFNRDFDRREDDLKALDGLTKTQVLKILSESINTATRKTVDILLFARQHTIKPETKATIDAIETFKRGREFVKRGKYIKRR
ncbi:MAG: insulinase family protein [Deltaproteobacteria bacterium]|nr:insulinase family protein [Deltaproteobacteria bacterium]